MPEGPVPPFAEPTGPAVDDASVLAAFARDEAAGHSPAFHVERPMLLVNRMVAAALRIGPQTILVRADLPPDLGWAKERVEEALTAEGMTCFDEETLLATPVVVQIVGLRASSWDLWDVDIDNAFATLRGAVVAEQPGPFSGA
ncbi:MAG: hypothetical protein KY441_09505 [Actinobacteria bacterium]|nr:hypothetical protein [Actinomycetota bacterium]